MASKHNIPSVITRDLPNAVTYDLTEPQSVTITLPRGSTWTSGLHWHETHTEYLHLIQGRIKVTLGNVTTVVEATADEKPVIEVPRFAFHEWQRAYPHEGDDVIVMEKTAPADGEKHLFFWNLNGVILDAPKFLKDPPISRIPTAYLRGRMLDLWITLNLFVIFYHLDNYPVIEDRLSSMSGFPPLIKQLKEWYDRCLSRCLLFLAALVGRLLDVQPVRMRYTPVEEYAAWIYRKDQARSRDE